MNNIIIFGGNNLESYRKTLTSNNYNLIEFKNSLDGLSFSNNNKDYDLIIINKNLPEIDSIEILKQIRHNCAVPIIIVSSSDDELNKIINFRLGANDYITKSISTVEFGARVDAHIMNYKQLKNFYSKSTREKIKINELEIHKNTRQVLSNRKNIALTQKEFELLLFLAENPNKIFSKKILFKKIWKLEAIGDIATVTVHIGRIRDKIERFPSNPEYIETIWGVGYRLKA